MDGVITQPCEAKTQSQIESEFEQLRLSQARLSELIGILENKLGKVLAKTKENIKSESGEEKTGILSEVSLEIRERRYTVDAQINMVSEVLERLSL